MKFHFGGNIPLSLLPSHTVRVTGMHSLMHFKVIVLPSYVFVCTPYSIAKYLLHDDTQYVKQVLLLNYIVCT